MKKLIRILWKYSLWLTLPVSIVFSYWLIEVSEKYFHFHVLQDNFAVVVGESALYQVGLNRFNGYLLDFKANWFLPDTTKENRLKKINLFVPEGSLAELNSDLPYSGREYVEAALWDSGKLEKVKMRYRGSFAYHWAQEKKSIRVKTRKSKLYNGMRRFNLVVPKTYEQINNYASYKLAEMMGLLVPRVDMVELFLNGKSKGAYLFLEDLEELTLRSNHLMPGDIYEGELITQDRYTGVSQNLFFHPSLWEKAAINNHYPEESKKPLEKLVSLVRNPGNPAAQKEMSEIMDMDAWGLFYAFQVLIQASHLDNVHNWRIYYDPARSKFVPVVHDPLGYTFQNEKVYTEFIGSDIHYALSMNKDFLIARSRALQRFFENGLDQQYLQKIEDVYNRLKPVILNDTRILVPAPVNPDDEPRSEGWPQFPFRIASPQEILGAIKKLEERIDDYLYQIKQVYYSPGGELFYEMPDAKGRLPLLISGNRAVEKITIRFLKPVKGEKKISLAYLLRGEEQVFDITKLAEFGDYSIEISHTLMPDYHLPPMNKQEGLQLPGLGQKESNSDTQEEQGYRPSYYELIFKDLLDENEILAIDVDFDGDVIKRAVKKESIEKSSFETLQNLVENNPSHTIVWNDNIVVQGTRQVEADLIIRPGTTIRLEPAANLIISGRLLVQGVAAQPVRFLPLKEGQEPWGVVALKGQGANSSELRHAIFKGGSGFKGDLFEYSGMVSIHDVDDALLDNCKFMDNNLVDDMVHIVYADATFKGCVFERSLMDALDIDISTARVESCHFVESGNDALDLMDSQVTVTDTILEKSGDKGISVGEGSRLLAINDHIKNNEIGIQVKDGSNAALYNLDFVGNKLALDAYKKNWRYGSGGKVLVDKNYFDSNKKVVAADNKSRIHVYDSYINPLPAEHKKRIVLDSSVDMKKDRQAKLLATQTSLRGEDMTADFVPDILNKIVSQRRGASNFVQH